MDLNKLDSFIPESHFPTSPITDHWNIEADNIRVKRVLYLPAIHRFVHGLPSTQRFVYDVCFSYRHTQPVKDIWLKS